MWRQIVTTSMTFLLLFTVWAAEPPIARAPIATECQMLERRVERLHRYELVVSMNPDLLETRAWTQIMLEGK